MAIGVDEVVGVDRHAEDGDRTIDLGDMNEGVAGANGPGHDLVARIEHAQIAQDAVGESAGKAEPLVDRHIDLAPEPADGPRPVGVFDDHDVRAIARRDIVVIGHAQRLDLVGRLLGR